MRALRQYLDRTIRFGLDGSPVPVWPSVLLPFALALLIGWRDPHGRA